MRKNQLSLADGAAPAVSDFSLCLEALLKSVQESLSPPALTNPMPEGRPTLVSAWGVDILGTFGGGGHVFVPMVAWTLWIRFVTSFPSSLMRAQ